MANSFLIGEMARTLWMAAAVFAVDVSLVNCRDERECSGLIAKAIVAGAKSCWLQTHAPYSAVHFSQCLSDFCSAKCSQDEQCSTLCKTKGHNIYDKVGSFLQNQIASVMDNPDELEELRVENPNAYAIVKSLLTKRSLGLLNPSRPSAPLSVARGEEESVSPAPSAKSFKQKDWLNWKPVDSSALVDDISMGNLRGSRNEASRGPHLSSSWTSIFSVHAPDAETHPAPTNPYLADAGWGTNVRRLVPHHNPYLVDFDTTPTKGAVVAKTSTSSYLKDLE